MLSKDEVRRIKENMLKGKQADAILINEKELQRIKDSTKIIGKQQEAEEKKRLAEEKQRERDAAELLKTKIKTFDQTRGKKVPLATLHKDTGDTMLTKAQRAMEENLDAVKNMNTMANFAKCAAIREHQLAEAKELERLKKEDDERLAMMMELERLRALQFHEEKEKIKKENQLQGVFSKDCRIAGDRRPNTRARVPKDKTAGAQGEGAKTDVEADQGAAGGGGEGAADESGKGQRAHGNRQTIQ